MVCTPRRSLVRHSLVRQALRAVEARTVTNGDGQPPSLYVGGCAKGCTVASEPLDAHPDAWQSVPPDAWVMMDRAGTTRHA